MYPIKLLALPRQGGKTTLLAEWCKEHNGTMICISEKEARRVHQRYRIDTVSINHKIMKGLRTCPVALDNLFLMDNPRHAISMAAVLAGQEKEVVASADPIFQTVTKEEFEKEIWTTKYKSQKAISAKFK